MLGLDILDVVIGLIFVYLVLSLICSTVSEMLLNLLFNWRAEYLEKGLKELFSGQSGKELLERFYQHPLIYSMFRGSYRGQEDSGKLPSYIPAKTFALVVADLVDMKADRTKEQSSESGPDVMDALRVLWHAADDDIDKARQNIEEWYNASMDRVSGWYKKHTAIISFLICLCVAVCVNADTIAIMQKLSHDKNLRASVTATTQQFLLAHQDKHLDSAQSSTAPNALEQVKADIGDIRNNLAKIEQTGLPLGWQPGDWQDVSHNVPKKLLGWLLTAFALTLGGSFWFDMLQNILRMSKQVRESTRSVAP